MDERDKVYEKLNQKFAPIAARLDDEGRVELDGLLWAIAILFAHHGETVKETSLQSS